MTFNIRFCHPLSLQISTFTGTYILICVRLRFTRLCLDDLQKTTQSLFWSYLVLSDISATAASAGKGNPYFWNPFCWLSGAALSVQGQLDHTGPRAAPSPLQGHLRSAMSMGRFFFLKPLFTILFMPSSCWICVDSLWHPGTCSVQGGSSAGEGQRGLVFPTLQIKAAWLLCKPPQVAMIFLKDLSLCRSKLIS